jgi:hypothetical protein
MAFLVQLKAGKAERSLRRDFMDAAAGYLPAGVREICRL